MQKPISKLKLATQFFITVPIMIAILFWPAGTLDWTEAWVYLVAQMGSSVIMAVYLIKYNPEVVRKRMEVRIPPKLWDKIIIILFSLAMVSLLIVPGLDIFRFGWSTPLSIYWEVIGFIVFMISNYLLFLVMKENSYLLKTVEIQKGQKVVSTGLYSFVRHPMYLAVIIMVFSIAILLGSIYTLIPAFLSSLSLMVRTHFEDKTLHKELNGYKEYAEKVRYKIIPWVW